MDSKQSGGPSGQTVGSRSKTVRFFGVVVVLVVVAMAVALSGMRRRMSADRMSETAITYTVARGPLTISVTEPGTVRALDQIEIKSEVEGQTTILYLVDEGKIVAEGELLVELDASSLNDGLVDQQIRVHNAEAAFIRAREQLAVTRNQTEADISKAQLDLQFAREDLVKYQEGDYPKQLMEVESRITLAREELEQAVQTLNWSQALFGEQYISHTELERDRLAHQRAGLDFQLAEANLALLRDYTHQRRLDELRSNAQQTEMALERVRLRSTADIVQAEADLRAREAELNRQKDRLTRIEDQIKKTRIYAPRAGMVVYATTGQSRWQSGQPLEEGQQVRERQTLIFLPSPGLMMVEVQVHESALDKIERGLPTRVTLDALPGRVYAGRVVRIAPLPDASTRWMNPDLKVYATQINLDGQAVDLRTGMSCRAEIIVENHDSVIAVPIQSVIRVNGKPTVYVSNGRGFVSRTIEIGQDNNRMVHVLAGLQEGEKVSLVPPLAEGAVPALRDMSEDQKPDIPAAGLESAMPGNQGNAQRGRNMPAQQSGQSRPPRSGETVAD